MITISVIGLDQYVVGHYSKDHTDNIANIYEVEPEEINFIAPNLYVFHNGVEQTSWNTIVKVNAPIEFASFEDTVSKYILNTMKEFSINVIVEFYYFNKKNRHTLINDSYPRYITEANVVNDDVEEYHDDCCDDEDCDCHHDHEEDLYDGNIFEGVQEKLDELYNEKKNK